MPHANPRTLPFAALDVKKVIVAYNAASPGGMSERVCRRYADAWSIPGGNLVGIVCGTGGTWTIAGTPEQVTATIKANVVVPIRNKLVEVGGKALILGPSVPARVNVARLNGSVGSYEADAAVRVPGSLWLMCARAKELHDADGVLVAIEQGSGRFQTFRLLTVSTVGNVNMVQLDSAPVIGSGDIVTDVVWADAGATFSVHDEAATADALDSSRTGFVPTGRLGWDGWNWASTGGAAETEAALDALVDRGQQARAIRSNGAHVDIAFAAPTVPYTSFAGFVLAMREWGINTTYTYRSITPSGSWATSVPLSGQQVTDAEFTSGPKTLPYFLRIGGTVNGEVLPVRLDKVSRIFPAPGACCATGLQSDVTKVNIDAIVTLGAVSGLTDTQHRTASDGLRTQAINYNLLRGMPLLTAAYGYQDVGMNFPIGDPLHAPFGPPEVLLDRSRIFDRWDRRATRHPSPPRYRL